jgi:putative ATPase
MTDLFNFTGGGDEAFARKPYQPLADRMRPQVIEDLLGQEHILGEGKPLRLLIEAGLSSSILLWGPPGCGKTTLARILANQGDVRFVQLSAVTSGIKDLKLAFEEAKNVRRMSGQKTMLFVDEIHRFNKAQQDALLPHIESGTIVFVGATTENPSFEVVSALLSRCQTLVLKPVSVPAIIAILYKALEMDVELAREPKIVMDEKSLEQMAVMVDGDARAALNVLETCAGVARQRNVLNPEITLELIKETYQNRVLTYDKSGDEHFNLISAFHKSLRGSDPDASLYWMYRMIEGGEDCRYILRRMIRFASEDIGMADPFALTLAMSAAQAFDYIGPPEGHGAMAHLAVYLATAPKSNSVYMAEKATRQYVRTQQAHPVPVHLRNAPTGFMQQLGYGKEYRYPHDYPGGFVPGETYFPEGCEDLKFYEPKPHGKEKPVAERLKQLWPTRHRS